MQIPLPFSAEALLDALAGVAYAVDGDGIILGFSRGPFLPQERDGSVAPWDCKKAVGTSIFAHMQGEQVLESYRILHQAVWSGGQKAIGFEYRCDAPSIERHMHMSISPIQFESKPIAVLYNSIIVSETPRVPLPLFAADLLTGRSPADPGNQVVKLCAYCQRVAWPVAAGEKHWIEAAEYYRQGGSSGITVSHSVCENCFDRLVVPALRSRVSRASEERRPSACGGGDPVPDEARQNHDEAS